ncbi:MAG: hypothetical protein IPJ94_11440 [Chloroflexi bacterium]|nr:hypothetical protein [Chloroflexota bacterium]
MNLINQPGLDEAAFCAEFYHLLYDGQPVATRLNQFFDFVKQQRLSPKWTFPTYFLFLRYPDNEIFIKPMMTRWFVDLMNGPKTYPWTPSGEAYEMMRDMFHQMKEALAKYDPQDMIDIHSMLWPAYRQAEKEASLTLAEPFATFFTDFEEANWAFELMHEAAISAGIVDKDDKRVAINVRSPYLRFNFGNWAFMEFKRGKVGLVFQEGKVPSTLFDYKWDKFAKSDMCLYFFNTNDLRPMHEKILTIYKQSCELVGKRFRRWKASNYRKAHQQELIEAVFDESVREKLLLEGLEYAPSDPTETTRYWRITLPEKLIVSTNSVVVEIPIWTVCRQYNIAAIDFSEDLSDPQVKKIHVHSTWRLDCGLSVG